MRILLATLLLCLMALPAKAADKQKFQVTYDMYAGGLNVVALDGTFDLQSKTYALAMNAVTKGLLGKMAPWKGALTTDGKKKTDTYTPQNHRFSSWWKGKEERTSFTYSPNGNFKSLEIINDDGVKKTDLPDAALTKGTVDMLTALEVMLAHFRKTDSCNISVSVFDGLRKFDMKFTDTGDAEIRKGKYSIYAGKARTCTIEIIPVAGKWHDKPRGWMSIQEQAKSGNKLPKIWIAKPASDVPAIPVRFEVYTKYGNIIMHLSALK